MEPDPQNSQYIARIPKIDPLYEPFGNYFDIEKITKSGQFFPYWIFGLSGNGKTYSVEQAHARNNKHLIIVPITQEADEDALLGGLRLENGNTVPFLGPISQAALLGCSVLLDEVDLSDAKLMCLQTVMQNKAYLIKRLGKIIEPKSGFNIVATANTKGRGSDDGKFMGANILNDSFLDRFVCTFIQDYPEIDVERKILYKNIESIVDKIIPEDSQFIERLILWAQKVRTTYKTGAINESITTRRLVHIARTYIMFGRERKNSVSKCLGRFTDDIRQSFLQFYELIDEEAKKKDDKNEKLKKAIEQGKDPGFAF